MEPWEQWSEAADQMALNMRQTRSDICIALAIMHGTQKVNLNSARAIMKLAEVHGTGPVVAAKFVEAVVCG